MGLEVLFNARGEVDVSVNTRSFIIYHLHDNEPKRENTIKGVQDIVKMINE